MSSDLSKRVPTLVAGVDVRALPLGALEGFLLSRIDGALDLGELGEVTGLGTGAVSDLVERLVSLGAAAWKGETQAAGTQRAAPQGAAPQGVVPERSFGRPRAPTPTGTATPSGRGAPSPPEGSRRANPVPPGVPRALYDPIELDDYVDLELVRRRQILDTYYQLEVLSFYQLLGVAQDADKQAVRAAYFQLSRVFHPDTMFRKRLGSYKPKMEAIFRRLTEAYQVLGKPKTRAAYDEYLVIQQVTQVTQRELAAGEQVAARAAARAGATPAHGISAVPRSHVVPPPPVTPATTPPPPRASFPPPVAPASTPSPVAPAASASERPAPTEAKRRRAQALQQFRLRGLGRDLGIGAPSGPTPTSTASAARRPSGPPPAPDPQVQAAREGVGRGLVQALQQTAQITGGTDLVARHLADGLRAERNGKLVEAVNAFNLARAIAPDREDVAHEHARVRRLLAVDLADHYVKQAAYEERNGKWGQAALSWARVCEGRPEDREAHRRTAEALLRSNGDLHRARSYAQRAVELGPDEAAPRSLLGRVFYAAGLRLNAKRELEHAARLDPSDELVKNLLRELK